MYASPTFVCSRRRAQFADLQDGRRASQRPGLRGGSDEGPQLYRPRHYHPGLGTFISRDPIGGPDESLYAYVGGRPVSSVDPTGLFEDTGWQQHVTVARFPGDIHEGQRRLSSRVTVSSVATKWFAFLTIGAQMKEGEDGLRWDLEWTLNNYKGSFEYPMFMVVAVDSRKWIDDVEQPRRLQHNIRTDYPGFTGAQRHKMDPIKGGQYKDPETGEPVEFDKVISNWIIMNHDGEETGNIFFLDGALFAPCKPARGKSTVWFWYSDILEYRDRKKVFGPDKASHRSLPALVAGYDIEWSFKPGPSGGFDKITVTKKPGPMIYGEAAITGATGIDFYNIVEKVTGYGEWRKPPVDARKMRF